MNERVVHRAARVGRGWGSRPILVVCGVGILIGAAAFAGKSLSGEVQLAESGDDPWMAAVRAGRFWSSGSNSSASPRSSGIGRARHSPSEDRSSWRSRAARSAPPSSEGRSSDQRRREPAGGGTYRTVCVRLCDGYYWPISFATDASNFYRDEKMCARSCSSPSRLYTYPNPGGEPEQMTDTSGVPYTSLSTAFLYRSEYVLSCKCKPDPWEQEAMDQHRLYALEARLRKGDKRAAAAIAALKAEIAVRQRVTKAGGSVKSRGNAGGIVEGAGKEGAAVIPQTTGAAPLPTPDQKSAGAALKASPAIRSTDSPSVSSTASP